MNFHNFLSAVSSLYDFLITTYNLAIGLITKDILIFIAVGAIILFAIWICLSLGSCFQRKFYKKCENVSLYLKNNAEIDKNYLNQKIEKISGGFSFAWQKFQNSNEGLPSDYIKRRESLDVEINGGVLNQGKTIMKSYIYVFTMILFIFNLAFLGKNETINCFVLAESMILPLIFFVVIKIFYFVFTSVKQQMYKIAVENFYDLVELLDENFGTRQHNVDNQANDEVETQDVDKKNVDDTESEKIYDDQQTENNNIEQAVNENLEQTENKLDKYDIFKKKNIDVEKLINEIPENNNSRSSPFINVDSDYVIVDDEKRNYVNPKIQSYQKTESKKEQTIENLEMSVEDNLEILNNDNPNLEYENDELEENRQNDLQQSDETTVDDNDINNNEKVEDEEITEENKEFVSDENVDVSENLIDNEKISDNIELVSHDEITDSDNQIENIEDDEMEEQNLSNDQQINDNIHEIIQPENMINDENEIVEDEPNKIIETEQPNNEDINNLTINESDGEIDDDSDSDKEDITTESTTKEDNIIDILDGFDLNDFSENNEESEKDTNEESILSQEDIAENDTELVKKESYSDNNSDVKTFDDEGTGDIEDYKELLKDLKEKINLDEGNSVSMDNFEDKTILKRRNSKDNAEKLNKVNKIDMDKIDNNLNVYDNFMTENDNIDYVAPVDNNKLKTRHFSKTSNKRGRPKFNLKVVEGMTIKNENEFSQALARAEKLMRKSEEGLSQSQTKKIEKELKILMDAMKKYMEK